MGQTSPNIQTFASARGAAYKVYNIIDHVSNETDVTRSTLYFPPAGELSGFITECALLHFGTPWSGFEAADRPNCNDVKDFSLIGAPAASEEELQVIRLKQRSCGSVYRKSTSTQ